MRRGRTQPWKSLLGSCSGVWCPSLSARSQRPSSVRLFPLQCLRLQAAMLLASVGGQMFGLLLHRARSGRWRPRSCVLHLHRLPNSIWQRPYHNHIRLCCVPRPGDICKPKPKPSLICLPSPILSFDVNTNISQSQQRDLPPRRARATALHTSSPYRRTSGSRMPVRASPLGLVPHSMSEALGHNSPIRCLPSCVTSPYSTVQLPRQIVGPKP
jgi:hypothetical protein